MKKLLMPILVVLSVLFISSVFAVDNLPTYIRPLSAGTIMPSQTFSYTFNFSNNIDCSNPLYTVSASITTDQYGLGYTPLDISGLTQAPLYQCEYSDGNLRKVHNVSSALFDNIYVAGNSYLNNMTIGNSTSTTIYRNDSCNIFSSPNGSYLVEACDGNTIHIKGSNRELLFSINDSYTTIHKTLTGASPLKIVGGINITDGMIYANASKLRGVPCSKIAGGTDTDFCTDDTAGFVYLAYFDQGANESSNVTFGNITTTYVDANLSKGYGYNWSNIVDRPSGLDDGDDTSSFTYSAYFDQELNTTGYISALYFNGSWNGSTLQDECSEITGCVENALTNDSHASFVRLEVYSINISTTYSDSWINTSMPGYVSTYNANFSAENNSLLRNDSHVSFVRLEAYSTNITSTYSDGWINSTLAHAGNWSADKALLPNVTFDEIAFTMGNFTNENDSIARAGNCSVGTVVQNITRGGVMCVADANGAFDYDAYFDQDLNTTDVTMFLKVNASDWTNITITESQISDLQSYLTSEADPLWSANESDVLYYTGFAAENITSGTIDNARISLVQDEVPDLTGTWSNTINCTRIVGNGSDEDFCADDSSAYSGSWINASMPSHIETYNGNFSAWHNKSANTTYADRAGYINCTNIVSNGSTGDQDFCTDNTGAGASYSDGWINATLAHTGNWSADRTDYADNITVAQWDADRISGNITLENTSQTVWADAQDTIFNDSMTVYVKGVNDTMKIYVDAQASYDDGWINATLAHTGNWSADKAINISANATYADRAGYINCTNIVSNGSAGDQDFCTDNTGAASSYSDGWINATLAHTGNWSADYPAYATNITIAQWDADRISKNITLENTSQTVWTNALNKTQNDYINSYFLQWIGIAAENLTSGTIDNERISQVWNASYNGNWSADKVLLPNITGVNGTDLNVYSINASNITISNNITTNILSCDEALETDPSGRIICGTDAGGTYSDSWINSTLAHTGNWSADKAINISANATYANEAGKINCTNIVGNGSDTDFCTDASSAYSDSWINASMPGYVSVYNGNWSADRTDYADNITVAQWDADRISGNITLENTSQTVWTDALNKTQNDYINSYFLLWTGFDAANITSGEIPDARVSNTLTCSDLQASSSVVADAEVDNDISIASTKPMNTTGNFSVNGLVNITASKGNIDMAGNLTIGGVLIYYNRTHLIFT